MTNVTVNTTETTVTRQENTTVVKVGNTETLVITQAKQGLPGGAGSSDHGALTGLGDDDHTQYHNDARGDARYYTKTQLDGGQLDSRYYTESEVNTALAGKSNVGHTHTSGDITDFTEAAQDAVGAALTDSATVDLSYNDAGNQITADVKDDSISDTKLRNSTALSVIGRASNTTGDPGDIAAASDHQVFRRSGNAVGFGAINLASPNAVSGVLPGANTTPPDFQYFSSSGTWTKPSGAKLVQVICTGGGQGGGSGRRGAAASNRYSGAGGECGYVTERLFLADQLSATETITIGAGGAGGAAQTSDSTNGIGGSNGGFTCFGGTVAKNSKLYAAGGSVGGGGGGSSAPVGSIGSSFTAQTQFFPGVPADRNNGVGGKGGISSYGPGSGAAGGGLNTSNTERDGGVGGAASSAFFSGGTGGDGTGGAAGGGNGTNGTDGTTNGTSIFYFGGGGSGGGSAAAAASGAGGDGGTPGGGGGGGGASANGFNSGAGGSGGSGGIAIVTYF